jgi:thiamine-phosphate pyrophosphorylase
MSLVFPPLYVIIDAVLLKTSEIFFAERMAESGVELLQYRHKHASSRELFDASHALSRRLAEISSGAQHGIRFIVNDRPDIALLVGAGGVHVGQEDIAVADARTIMNAQGPGRWVGVSTHNMEQVDAANRTDADYIAFGPVFPTSTKERADPVVGLARLAEARARTRKPLVGIGGITLERAADTYRAGADSLSVARDVIAAPDPGARAREFLAEAARVLNTRAKSPRAS